MNSDFKQIEIGDAEVIGDYARHARDSLCELAFANLMIWRDYDRPSFAFLDGNLCIKISPPDERPFFLEPLGENGACGAVHECLKRTGKLSRLSAGFVASLNGGGYRARALRDHFDYIYRVDELSELKGRRFDGKRNHIRRMKRLCPNYEYIKLEKKHASLAGGLFENWQETKHCERCATRFKTCCQRMAIERAFENYDELGLIGGALVSNGGFIGFIIASQLSADTVCAHLSYTRPDVSGSSQALLWEACRNTFSNFKYVNMEQDMGLAGLRKTKSSYYPARLGEKFEIEAGL